MSKAEPTLEQTMKQELKKAQKFKPAPGVEFTQYDELGIEKGTGEDLR